MERSEHAPASRHVLRTQLDTVRRSGLRRCDGTSGREGCPIRDRPSRVRSMPLPSVRLVATTGVLAMGGVFAHAAAAAPPPAGGLVQLAPPLACFSTVAAGGCASLGGGSITGPSGLASTPDGLNVYAVGGNGGAAAFDRAVGGALTSVSTPLARSLLARGRGDGHREQDHEEERQRHGAPLTAARATGPRCSRCRRSASPPVRDAEPGCRRQAGPQDRRRQRHLAGGVRAGRRKPAAAAASPTPRTRSSRRPRRRVPVS